MALANTRVSVVGESIADDLTTKLASFGAVVSNGSNEISLTMRILDDDLYEANKDDVTADRADFEALALSLQDFMKTQE